MVSRIDAARRTTATPYTPASDEITVAGTFEQDLKSDAGGGGDTIIVGFNGGADFLRPLTVTGGAGNDNFLWRNRSNNCSSRLSHFPPLPRAAARR